MLQIHRNTPHLHHIKTNTGVDIHQIQCICIGYKYIYLYIF